MSRTNVKRKGIAVKQKIGWDKAISDAKTCLEMAEERAANLRSIVADFEQMKESGQPWPGESATQN